MALGILPVWLFSSLVLEYPFCVPVTAAQVMTRLQLPWLVQPVENAWEAAGTFRVIGFMVLTYFVVDRLMGIFIYIQF